MFQLSTVFCQAYDKTTAANQLGLPYPTEPEKVVGRLIERGTLAELYQKIEADMLNGYFCLSVQSMQSLSSTSPSRRLTLSQLASISMHNSMTRQ